MYVSVSDMYVSVSDMSVSLTCMSVSLTGVFLSEHKPVALVCSGGAMNTDMSAFMGLSPNNDLKTTLFGRGQHSWA